MLAGFPVYGSEVLSRTTPNLLDLAIALVAGAIATYGKVHSRAVSSLAGTAIAVALVPPVCVFGLLLAVRDWDTARGAGLLFAANLLGILSGGLITLAAITPGLRDRLWSSRLGLISLLLTALLLVPLTGSFLNLVAKARRESALQQVERAIAESLRARTITLGQDSELMGTTIDWSQNPPLITASVRVSKPNLPTPKQVAAVQKFINRRQPINFRLLVQRLSIDVIGPETAPNPPEATEQLVQPRTAEPAPGRPRGARVARPGSGTLQEGAPRCRWPRGPGSKTTGASTAQRSARASRRRASPGRAGTDHPQEDARHGALPAGGGGTTAPPDWRRASPGSAGDPRLRRSCQGSPPLGAPCGPGPSMPSTCWCSW